MDYLYHHDCRWSNKRTNDYLGYKIWDEVEMGKKQNSIYSPIDDLKWRARDDARIIAQAEEIKGDKKRLSLATKAARELYADKKKEAESLGRVAQLSKPKKK